MVFDYKCILVTGATSGIGRAIAERLAAAPSKPQVIGVGRRQDRLDELEKSSGGRIKGLRADIGSGDKAKALVEAVLKDYPQLDAVIFNAGVQYLTDFSKPESIDVDELATELDLNFTSIVQMCTLFMPHFLKQGRGCFLPVSSGLAILPIPRTSHYCATKAALHSFSLTLRMQLKDTGIRVREIMPPLVESELHDHQGDSRAHLSKIWIPLDKYADETVRQLFETDDDHLLIGGSAERFEQFEKGKMEAMEKIVEAMRPKV